MKSSEIETTQMQSTSAYWGYRELGSDEVMSVAGGYDGTGDGFGGGTGYGGNDSPGTTGQSQQDAENMVNMIDKAFVDPLSAILGMWGLVTKGPPASNAVPTTPTNLDPLGNQQGGGNDGR